MSQAPSHHRYVSADRRVREDRRFVVGKGKFVADMALPNTKHVALVTCPHAAARIVSIDASRALKMPGVHYVLEGRELAAATLPLMTGLDTPNVPRRPLAFEVARYSGEWVAAVVADSRALAEDAAEEIDVQYEALPFVLDAEKALEPASPLVHEAHGSNVLLDKNFVWGDVEKDFAASPRKLSLRVKWGRSSTVPIETFGVVANWDPWRDMLDVYASIQMPRYADQIGLALKIPVTSVRVHHDVDVGGSYGVKRGIKHTVLAGYLSRRLGFPVRLIEDRLENMRGGDAHGPERLFDVDVAFDDAGIVRSMKMRALENVGAYAGRSPFQLGKPIGAIVGPYKIKSVQYRAIAVVTNKTTQDAVRGFGQGPTNLALERCMDEVAHVLGLDPIEIRRRNMIRHDEFPYLIPSGTTYDSGDYHIVIDKVVADSGYENLKAERDRLRAQGKLAGIGVAACLEPSGGNATFEALLNPAITTSTFMDSCRINVDGMGFITATMHTTSSGQGHETLLATVIGEVLQVDPDIIRVTRPDSLNSLPSGTPVGSRMAIMLGGAAFHAAEKLRTKFTTIAAHDLGIPLERAVYAQGNVHDRNAPAHKRTWAELVQIAYRNYHRMPAGMQPGLAVEHIYQVPTGGTLPTADGRVQMYPCFSFEFHLLLISIDPDLGRPEIVSYRLGHDCGTQISPKIVRGMTIGGIAHGIGAALYEEFAYNDDGQLIAQTFMDYLLPSSHEVPAIEIFDHETPSPYTVLGQKGTGESGYLGAPAAIANAINDALRPLGISTNTLPIKVSKLGDMIAQAREKIKAKKDTE
ncbi:MAG: xanthine dehydrogenase family protein molybdopterin-binding subunit [Pseudolabrys sp.]|nr:xanthine dehydrogenase family protein molybdopterin-binding subunit [Pseudolabrys sp.]MSP32542.1 xanthine dehydrogenase family protein molybdopterin-binding subunit [Pseudolabrys sp.]